MIDLHYSLLQVLCDVDQSYEASRGTEGCYKDTEKDVEDLEQVICKGLNDVDQTISLVVKCSH